MVDKVCMFFFWVGVGTLLISSGNCFMKWFDINVSIVLIPMSIIFCLMIILIDNLWFSKE
jgi:hypothetical protein